MRYNPDKVVMEFGEILHVAATKPGVQSAISLAYNSGYVLCIFRVSFTYIPGKLCIYSEYALYIFQASFAYIPSMPYIYSG